MNSLKMIGRLVIVGLFVSGVGAAGMEKDKEIENLKTKIESEKLSLALKMGGSFKTTLNMIKMEDNIEKKIKGISTEKGRLKKKLELYKTTREIFE